MPTTSKRLHDGFAVEGERAWTSTEQERLIALYEQGCTVYQIAQKLRVDQKDVAARLIRCLLDPEGRIDNDDDMPNAHTRYSKFELQRRRDAYSMSVPLNVLAKQLGRSQLGVGWKMLDLKIPDVPPALTTQTRRS